MINLLVIGDSHTGKTSLITTFCNGVTPEPYQAFGIDLAYQHKSLDFSNKAFNLQIWDAQNCRSLAQEPFTSSEGVILMFSMSDRASFESIRDTWMDIIHRDLGLDVSVVLVGNVYENKNKLVSSNEAQMLVEEYQMRYYEVDVMKREQVEDMFMGVLSQIDAQKDIYREEHEYSMNLHAYMNAFKSEMFAYMDEMRRRDREEMEMRLRRIERQVKNKSQGVLEVNKRISEVEDNEEAGDDSLNASIGERDAADSVQKTLDDEVIELKRKVEELNHKFHGMTNFYPRQSPSHEIIYGGDEIKVPRSVNLDDNLSSHPADKRRSSKTFSWRKKFNLTIATPDSSSSPKNLKLTGLSEDGSRQFRAKAQSYIADSNTRANGASKRFNTQIGQTLAGLVRSANPSPHPQIKVHLPIGMSQTPQGGDSSFNDAHSLMRMENSGPSMQDEIAMLWKTINTIIENTQEQMERLRVSTVNLSENQATITTAIQESVLLTDRDRKVDEAVPVSKEVKAESEEKDNENNEKQVQKKDLKTVIREVKDDVHNQILGIHREVERELNTLRDTLLGHYSVFSEKIHLENDALRKYVDEKIDDIINEMHHAMMINQQEKQVEQKDRAMSECTIMRKANQPLQDFESDILIVDRDSGERLNLTQSLVEQNKKQIQMIQEELVKSIWETIGMMASRITRIEKNVSTNSSLVGSLLLK